VVGSSRKIAATEAGQAAHHAQVLVAGLELVDRRILACEADRVPDGALRCDDVEAHHARLAGVRSQKRGQDPHHRRPARADEFVFGLERVLDGIGALVRERGAADG
jgi:hypothetical protein